MISADDESIRFWLLGGLACAFHVEKLYRKFGDIDLITKDKESCKILCRILERLEFERIAEKNLAYGLIVGVYQNKEGINVDITHYTEDFGLKMDDFEKDKRKLGGVELRVVSKRFCVSYKKYWLTKRNEKKDVLDLNMLNDSLII